MNLLSITRSRLKVMWHQGGYKIYITKKQAVDKICFLEIQKEAVLI